MIQIRNQISFLILLILSLSCQEKQTKAIDGTKKETTTASNSNAAVQVSFEGKLHTLNQNELDEPIATFTENKIQFLLKHEGKNLQVNFNLTNTGILKKGAAVYKLPEINDNVVFVDLVIFDFTRKGNFLNNRIVFKKGTINITKLTIHQLNLTFEGVAANLVDYKDTPFPINGKINITY